MKHWKRLISITITFFVITDHTMEHTGCIGNKWTPHKILKMILVSSSDGRKTLWCIWGMNVSLDTNVFCEEEWCNQILETRIFVCFVWSLWCFCANLLLFSSSCESSRVKSEIWYKLMCFRSSERRKRRRKRDPAIRLNLTLLYLLFIPSFICIQIAERSLTTDERFFPHLSYSLFTSFSIPLSISSC